MNFILIFRFYLHRVERVDDMVEEIEIPDVMFSTNRLRQRGFYDAILLTLTKQPVQQVDSAITKGVSNYSLFYFNNTNAFMRFLFIY